MGTSFRIVLHAKDVAQADHAFQTAFQRVDQLNRLLSDYLTDSELSRLSLTAGTGKAVPLSDDLQAVLTAASRISRDTTGAFDITVGPYARLWKIARAKRELPHPDRMERFRKSVGHAKIRLQPHQQTAELTAPDMFLDLGGIAKGYAADAVLSTLAKLGIRQALVDAGGDLVLGDPPPGKPGWVVAIGGRKHPELPRLTLSNCAVATSGDIEQSLDIEGVTYSHIVDPRTGIGLTNRIQATLVAADGTTADALASAACVLGSDALRPILQGKHPNARAYILQKTAKATQLTVIHNTD